MEKNEDKILKNEKKTQWDLHILHFKQIYERRNKLSFS